VTNLSSEQNVTNLIQTAVITTILGMSQCVYYYQVSIRWNKILSHNSYKCYSVLVLTIMQFCFSIPNN